MRITNRMMTNNMLYNINGNKNSLSKLEQQYSTGKKIQKPSEDPIVAVRALKLRTNLSELTQYHEKNIPDALAWMDVTEGALKVVNSILTQVHTYCVQGATDTLNADDRNTIIKNLTEMKQQIYQEGDTNYAGRYVFTGYKTNTSLVFDETQSNEKYEITEQFGSENIDVIKKAVNDCNLSQYDPDNPGDTDLSNKPNMVDVYRIRLSYNSLDDPQEDGKIEIRIPQFDDEGNITGYDEITDIDSMLSTEEGAYELEDGDGIRYLPDTGELLLSKDMYDELRYEDKIEVTYEKTNFIKNDLRPEHYFNCTVTDLSDEDKEPIVYTKENQEIKYEVNFDQKITINTQGYDAIQHDAGRTIDEMLSAVNDVIATEAKIAEIEEMLKDTKITAEQERTLNEMLELMNAELTLKSEVMQDTFGRALTKIEQQQDVVNVATSDLGARYVRLQLTESRLGDEKTDFTDLLSTNEDVNMVDTIIKFRAMYSIYNASLSAAAQSVQTTLLDFL